MTFAEYVGFYGLARSEGLVLRYLADAYKALRQTVPEAARTEELDDLTEWLGELVRQVDSSLLDEWERLRTAGARPTCRRAVPRREAARRSPPTRGPSGCWCATRCSAGSSWPRCAARRLGELDAEAGWDADAWAEAMAGYFAEHDELRHRAGRRAGRRLLMVTEEPGRWVVRQIFDDPAGDHDWGITAEVDLAASDEAGAAVVRVTAVDRLD